MWTRQIGQRRSRANRQIYLRWKPVAMAYGLVAPGILLASFVGLTLPEEKRDFSTAALLFP